MRLLACIGSKVNNVVTSDLNRSFMCTSNSKNPERSLLGVLQSDSSILWLAQFDRSVLGSFNVIDQFLWY